MSADGPGIPGRLTDAGLYVPETQAQEAVALGPTLFLPQHARDAYQEKTNVLLRQLARYCRDKEQFEAVSNSARRAAAASGKTVHEILTMMLDALAAGTLPANPDIAAALSGLSVERPGGVHVHGTNPLNRAERRAARKSQTKTPQTRKKTRRKR